MITLDINYHKGRYGSMTGKELFCNYLLDLLSNLNIDSAGPDEVHGEVIEEYALRHDSALKEYDERTL